MKDLKIKTRCPKPFDTILIDKNGSCFLCECSGWLPFSVGNLQLQTLEEILQNEKAEEIRKTIIQGTYKHCRENLCSYLLQKSENIRQWNIDIPKIQLREIRLGHDDSCNLPARVVEYQKYLKVKEQN